MSDIESTAPVIVTPAATPAPQSESTADQIIAPEGDSPEAVEERVFKQSEVDKIVQTRLAKESRRLQKVADAEARANFAERERDDLRARLNPTPVQPSGKPTTDQFKDYDSYIDALTDWKVKEQVSGIRQENQAQQQQRSMNERAAAIRPNVEAAKAKYDDFEDVAYSYRAPDAMQAAMVKSAHVGELYYHLGANPAERERIASLDEIDQVYAIRDLEKTLFAASAPTRTPAPIVANSSKSPMPKSLGDMSYDEFVTAREKRLKTRKR